MIKVQLAGESGYKSLTRCYRDLDFACNQIQNCNYFCTPIETVSSSSIDFQNSWRMLVLGCISVIWARIVVRVCPDEKGC